MLMLERRSGQGFTVGGVAKIKVTEIRGGNRVKVLIDAPKHIDIVRDEINKTHQAPDSRFSSVSVAYVEDDRPFADLLSEGLQLHNVGSVHASQSAEQLKEYLERVAGTPDQPTVVLVDYHLPGQPGLNIVEWIRQHPVLKRLPVVMLSGEDSDTCVDGCFDAGASAFMLKPPDFSGLVTTLESLLQFWAAPSRKA